jgi:hypothetical protein
LEVNVKEITIGTTHVTTDKLRDIPCNKQNRVLLKLAEKGMLKTDEDGNIAEEVKNRYAIFSCPINYHRRETYAFAHVGNGLFAVAKAATHDVDQFCRKTGRLKATAKVRGMLREKNGTSVWLHVDNLPADIPEKVTKAMKFQYKMETKRLLEKKKDKKKKKSKKK